jgi:hypothetical protein
MAWLLRPGWTYENAAKAEERTPRYERFWTLIEGAESWVAKGFDVL